MDFALDDEQALIVQTVRRFVDKDVRAWAADADRAGEAPARLAPVAGDLGFFLDAVPEADGGLLDGAFSHLRRALRGYELGRGCAAMAALLETNVEPALAVGRWGSAAAKAALFGALTAGGLATTGRDSRGLLSVVPDGDGMRVTGKVGPLPALGKAAYVLLAARTTAGEPVLLLVDAARRQPVLPQAWRAAAWGTLTLDAAPVAADFVLARGHAADEAIAEVLTWAKASLAARAAGVAVAGMEHARKYAGERIQFGQPIGKFESLIRLRDDAETGAAAVRLMALHAAWLADKIKDAPSRAAAADAASRARVHAGDVVNRATIDAVQILGGYGFVNDYPVEKLMRDARPFEQLLGDERFDRILADQAAQP
ncbi:MAG TPA: acyl-CoA dehydrogenase family protein [Kofleriaceae bacterium]|nr:acyl-CoA dehydrogenase family protein [Kofleriaceae bacterium]